MKGLPVSIWPGRAGCQRHLNRDARPCSFIREPELETVEGDGLVFPVTTSCGSDPGMPPPSVLVWDIETVPDLRAVAAAQGLVRKSDDEVRHTGG